MSHPEITTAATSSAVRVGKIETDYLVVGAGAAGMAFADSLVTHSQADVVIVDRRHKPGGHWNDAYPFVRLHSPSAYYGVNSLALGADTIDRHGLNAGLYERASGAAICDYFARVLDEQLMPSGRVRFLGMHDYTSDASGRHRVVSRLTGAGHEVTVKQKVVDATYLQAEIPATHTPSFHVDPAVRIVPINGLVSQSEPSPTYTLIGGGKTAMDACLWLLENGIDPDRIRWIRPREAWLFDRTHYQPLDLVASVLDGLSRDMEALAGAASVDDLFQRLERSGRLLRMDTDVTPTMFRCATVTQSELVELRRVRDVIRRGRVRRIEPTRIVFDQGSVPSRAGDLYVDCSATRSRRPPAKPIFAPDRITLQVVRSCQRTFSAALIGYLEATRADIGNLNHLCPVNPDPDKALDWLHNIDIHARATQAWSTDPDLMEWLEKSRLNLAAGVKNHKQEPLMQQAVGRYQQFAELGQKRLHELIDQISGALVG